MKLTYLASATVIVEVGSCRILMDPWLTDGEYYGAWAQYPAFDWRGWSFEDIDFIYVSHIHPDHISAETMRRLPRSIPVLIHSYEAKFLRRSIEALGFEVRELPHNRRVPLKDSAYINILAADDCNPELCGRFFSCSKFEVRLGSTQIDSLCVIDDGRHVLVNVNDCPRELSRHLMPKIKSAYRHVDMLLVGYGGAGPYPQCFGNLTEAQKIAGAAAKERKFLEQAVGYIHELAPRYYLPFAGQYTLCGRLSQLDDYRGVPELDEAATYLSVASPGSRCALLNCGATFDIASGQPSTDYVPIDIDRKRAYRDEVLAKRALAYDGDDPPGQAELETLVKSAFGRLAAKRREIGFESDTAVYVDLASDHLARVPMRNEELSIVPTPLEEPHVRITADPKLLRRLLSGPRLAHWNNAEIGSHLRYERRPDVYERGLYYTMCFFHA